MERKEREREGRKDRGGERERGREEKKGVIVRIMIHVGIGRRGGRVNIYMLTKPLHHQE